MTAGAAITRPIFIVGSARSGTVFLGEALKLHPNVHCLIEHPRVFNYASNLALDPAVQGETRQEKVNTLRRLYSETWRMTPANCHSCSPECRELGKVSRWPWSNCYHDKQVLRYADKSHQLVLNVPLVLEAFPDAQFLHIVRDGRDVVASMLRHKGVLSWFSERYINQGSVWPRTWFGVTSGEEFKEWSQWGLAKKCALRWRSWVQVGLDAAQSMAPAQWLDLRYEELVTQPAATSARVFDFLQLSPQPDCFAHARPDSIGNWRRQLAQSDLDDVDVVAGELLRDLGYADA